MVVPMAMEAKAAREANGLVILQKGEAKCLEKIRLEKLFLRIGLDQKFGKDMTFDKALVK